MVCVCVWCVCVCLPYVCVYVCARYRTWFYKDVPDGVSVLEHNFDHPSALDEELMVATLATLKRREPVRLTPYVASRIFRHTRRICNMRGDGSFCHSAKRFFRHPRCIAACVYPSAVAVAIVTPGRSAGRWATSASTRTLDPVLGTICVSRRGEAHQSHSSHTTLLFSRESLCSTLRAFVRCSTSRW